MNHPTGTLYKPPRLRTSFSNTRKPDSGRFTTPVHQSVYEPHRMSHYSYPLNDERERMLDRLEGQTDTNTRADAIDAAIRHYLESVENLQEASDQLTPEQARLISTSEVSLTYYPKVR